MAKLELALLVGAESKAFLESLTKQIDRLEKLSTGKSTASQVEEDEDEDEEDEPAPKKALKKAAKPVEEDEDEEADEDEEEAAEEDDAEEDEEEEPAPKKKGKAKKVTVDDCQDAAKKLAAEQGRQVVVKLMKKHFKTDSVSEVKPADYERFVQTMTEALEE